MVSRRSNPLLSLPAVGDNAAMPTEPANSEPPKRKRRWCQFSLRTAMIVVTLFCTLAGGYVVRLRSIIAERRAELDRLIALESKGELSIGRGGGSIPPDLDDEPFEQASPSQLRQLLGDEAVGVIAFVKRPTEDEVQQLARVFPEAFIVDYEAFGSPNVLAGPQ
jgi:hypothetical protein